MKVLITGRKGFLAGNLAEMFHDEGHDVSIMGTSSFYRDENLRFNYHFYNLSGSDEKCDQVFRTARFDVILYLSGSDREQETGTESSLADLASLLQLSEKYRVQKFVFASPLKLSSISKEASLKEETPCQPAAQESALGWAGELYCTKWQETSQMKILCFRLSNLYGPGQELDGDGGDISSLINQALQGKKLTIQGSGRETKNYVYVEDAAAAIYRGVEKDADGIYHVSANTEVSMDQVVEQLDKLTAITGVEYIEKAGPEPAEMRLDNSKLKQELDWEPLHSFEEGLEKTYNWQEKHSRNEESKGNGKKEHRSLMVKPVFPYLANIGLFILAVLVSSTISNYLYMVDYQLFYIVFAAFLLGRKQAILAIGLSTAWFFYESIFLVGRDLVALLIDHNTITHIGLYACTGLIIGYALEKREKQIAELKEETANVKGNYQTLNDAYHDTLIISEELKNQVLYTNNSMGTVYSIMKRLDSLEPAEIYASSIPVFEQVMKGAKAGLYILNQNQEVLKLAAGSGNLDIQASLKVKEKKCLLSVKETNRIYVNKELDQTLPSMVVPLSINGSVIGMVMVYDLAFEQLNLFNQNMMAMTAELVSSALYCAYQHQELLAKGKIDMSLPFYNEEEAYA